MKRKFYFVMIAMIVGTLFVSCEDPTGTDTGTGVTGPTLKERAGTYGNDPDSFVLKENGDVEGTIKINDTTIYISDDCLVSKMDNTDTSVSFTTTSFTGSNYLEEGPKYNITLDFASPRMVTFSAITEGNEIGSVVLQKRIALKERAGTYTGNGVVMGTMKTDVEVRLSNAGLIGTTIDISMVPGQSLMMLHIDKDLNSEKDSTKSNFIFNATAVGISFKITLDFTSATSVTITFVATDEEGAEDPNLRGTINLKKTSNTVTTLRDKVGTYSGTKNSSQGDAVVDFFKLDNSGNVTAKIKYTNSRDVVFNYEINHNITEGEGQTTLDSVSSEFTLPVKRLVPPLDFDVVLVLIPSSTDVKLENPSNGNFGKVVLKKNP